MTTKNVTYLQNHGPSTNDELPSVVERRHREAGIRSFKLRGNQGNTTKMGGHPTTVYYLPEHDKTAVLRRFLDINSGLVEAKPRHGLHRVIRDHGREWLEAARKVTSEYYDPDGTTGGHGTSYTEEHVCDFCGVFIQGNYPHHLAEECEETGE